MVQNSTPQGEGPPALNNCTGREVTLFWFRRDLRLRDNTGLYHALKNHEHVLPVFIFDRHILDKLHDRDDRRVSFIHQQITELKATLEQLGSTLYVHHGTPLEAYAQLCEKYQVKAVYANGDYEPYARHRDDEVYHLLGGKGIPFKLFKDQVIFEKDEVLKANGTPYTVFTPYSRAWKALLSEEALRSHPVEQHFDRLLQLAPLPMPGLEQMGFAPHLPDWPALRIDSQVISDYHHSRDIPSAAGTSRLSVHLRFGTLSIRELVRETGALNEKYLDELIWREFYQMILWHFPYVAERSFKPGYDRIEWCNDPGEFKAWCNGLTGYPLVDAGMRELNATGLMHNRARMITASFLTKHLLIDWRWGEAYFAQKLLDFDLASNNGGWQWAAGTGVDAVPYFRVFNPVLQQEKFDPDMAYTRHWVPEYGTPDYPKPITDHTTARERALLAYKKALETA